MVAQVLTCIERRAASDSFSPVMEQLLSGWGKERWVSAAWRARITPGVSGVEIRRKEFQAPADRGYAVDNEGCAREVTWWRTAT